MLSGRCSCKTVTYRAEDCFVVAYNCHCSNCRALTGSAFLPWGEIEPTKLSITGGTDSLHVDGDAEAIHAMRCGRCWSLVYWTVHHHDRIWLRVPYGTLNESPALRPTAHIFVGSKAAWYEICDDLPQHDEYPWS
jgi:hypothetical protein